MPTHTSINARRCPLLCIPVLILLLHSVTQAAYLKDVPQTLRQPNGELLHCYASGDEYHNWLHDANGYTIIQDPVNGFYVFAWMQEGKLAASPYVVGQTNPSTLDLKPGLNLTPEQVQQKWRQFGQSDQAWSASTDQPVGVAPAFSIGLINNVVVFIRFSDEGEFSIPLSTYTSMFTSQVPAANSMANYFQEVSYSQFAVQSTFYPIPSGDTVISWQDSHPRAYYKPYNAATNPIGYQGGDDGTERRSREHSLLKNAVDTISSQVPAGLTVDADSDGFVDNVCFIVSGSPEGWASLLWPHKWGLYSVTATINGKRVWNYNFQLQNATSTGVLCHEMSHTLGFPDLYHYSFDDMNPVGRWDLMEFSGNPPVHMGAYMKYRYGHWINSIPEITASGIYALNPLTSSSGNCYRIASPNSASEYFVVEYRRRVGTFESSLPGDGLLVYRINTARDGQGNADAGGGVPDEVYIYRPNGTPYANGNYLNAHFSSNVARTAINDSTNPSSFLWDGSPGGLDISSIGSSGSTIAFMVTGGGMAVSPDLSIAKTHSGIFVAGRNGIYTITVSNMGSGTTTGPMTVTDPLPNGLSFVSGTGDGWDCAFAGQSVTCFHNGFLGVSEQSTLTLTVAVGAEALPSVTNTATVTTPGDSNSSNNSVSDNTSMIEISDSPRADFNGDGKTDILWRNSADGRDLVWLMNGTSFSQAVSLNTVTNTDWKIVGTGNFNPDGNTDIVWRNSSDGRNTVWLMNGSTFSQAVSLNTVASADWKIVGTGDFNQDGKADIVWRNSNDGRNTVWLMNGTSFYQAVSLNTVTNADWKIAGTGDFNQDGKIDILWRNSADGRNVVWLMNGTSFLKKVDLNSVASASWEIVNH